MTRGKYARRAATARVDRQIETEIEAYQRNIRTLTASNRELTEALAAERAGRQADVQRLRSERDLAVSPEMHAREATINQLRQQLSTTKASLVTIEKQRNKLRHRVWEYMHVVDGVTGLQMIETLANDDRADEGLSPATVADHYEQKLGAVGARRLQQSRGERP